MPLFEGDDMALGCKQDKQEGVEWLERGKELCHIDGLVKVWRDMLPEEFVKQIMVPLGSFRARCSAPADVKAKC